MNLRDASVVLVMLAALTVVLSVWVDRRNRKQK